MRYVLRAVLFLVLAAGLALLGFAMFSELPAPKRQIEITVEPK